MEIIILDTKNLYIKNPSWDIILHLFKKREEFFILNAPNKFYQAKDENVFRYVHIEKINVSNLILRYTYSIQELNILDLVQFLFETGNQDIRYDVIETFSRGGISSNYVSNLIKAIEELDKLTDKYNPSKPEKPFRTTISNYSEIASSKRMYLTKKIRNTALQNKLLKIYKNQDSFFDISLDFKVMININEIFEYIMYPDEYLHKKKIKNKNK